MYICVPVQVLCAAAVNPAVFLYDHQQAIKVRKETSPGPNGGKRDRRSNDRRSNEGDQEVSISLVWVVTGVPNLTKVRTLLYRNKIILNCSFFHLTQPQNMSVTCTCTCTSLTFCHPPTTLTRLTPSQQVDKPGMGSVYLSLPTQVSAPFCCEGVCFSLLVHSLIAWSSQFVVVMLWF